MLVYNMTNSPEKTKLWMDKIKMENNNDFEVLVVKPGSIHNYLNQLQQIRIIFLKLYQ